MRDSDLLRRRLLAAPSVFTKIKHSHDMTLWKGYMLSTCWQLGLLACMVIPATAVLSRLYSNWLGKTQIKVCFLAQVVCVSFHEFFCAIFRRRIDSGCTGDEQLRGNGGDLCDSNSCVLWQGRCWVQAVLIFGRKILQPDEKVIVSFHRRSSFWVLEGICGFGQAAFCDGNVFHDLYYVFDQHISSSFNPHVCWPRM